MRRRPAVLAAAVLAAACAARVTPVAPPAAPDPVQAILGAPEGIVFSPEGREALASCRRDPEATVAAVARQYPVTALAGVEGRDLRLERAIRLLAELHHPSGDALLGRWFHELRRARARPGAPELLPPYDRLVLGELDGRYDSAVAGELLAGLSALGLTDRVAAFRYLASVAAGHPDVPEALARDLRDPASPLYGDDLLRRVVETLAARTEAR